MAQDFFVTVSSSKILNSKEHSSDVITLSFALQSKTSGQVQAACNTSHVGENSTITLYDVFFIDGETVALT